MIEGFQNEGDRADVPRRVPTIMFSEPSSEGGGDTPRDKVDALDKELEYLEKTINEIDDRAKAEAEAEEKRKRQQEEERRKQELQKYKPNLLRIETGKINFLRLDTGGNSREGDQPMTFDAQDQIQQVSSPGSNHQTKFSEVISPTKTLLQRRLSRSGIIHMTRSLNDM